MENVIEEKTGLAATDTGGVSAEERANDEEKKRKHRERARAYYWRHRDALREAAKNKGLNEREKEQPRMAVREGDTFPWTLLVLAGVAIFAAMRERKKQQSQTTPPPAQDTGTFDFDIGGGKIIQVKRG